MAFVCLLTNVENQVLRTAGLLSLGRCSESCAIARAFPLHPPPRPVSSGPKPSFSVGDIIPQNSLALLEKSWPSQGVFRRNRSSPATDLRPAAVFAVKPSFRLALALLPCTASRSGHFLLLIFEVPSLLRFQPVCLWCLHPVHINIYMSPFMYHLFILYLAGEFYILKMNQKYSFIIFNSHLFMYVLYM